MNCTVKTTKYDELCCHHMFYINILSSIVEEKIYIRH